MQMSRGNWGPERTMFVFRGFALGDLAVAARVYSAARVAGIGTMLVR